MNAPCKNCQERELHCHSKCTQYTEWKQQYEALKKELYPEDMNTYSERTIRKAWRNMRYWNRKYSPRRR